MGLKEEIVATIQATPDDRELSLALSRLDQDNPWDFGNTVASWGPLLYDRNRQTFQSLIERHINDWNARQVKDLKGWMEKAESNGDTYIYRTLLQAWLNEEYGWGKAQEAWEKMLLERFQAARSRLEREQITKAFDLWYDLEDETAVQLYQIEPEVLGPWVVSRLERQEWYDIVYPELAAAAKARGDKDLYMELYRRTFTYDEWKADVDQLLKQVADPTELDAELQLRHLDHPDASLPSDAYLLVLEARGEDVLAYCLRNIPRTWSWGGTTKAWRKILDLAEENGWWQLWTTVVKTQSDRESFSPTVGGLLRSSHPEWLVGSLLARVAGATYGWREWQQPAPLTETVGLELYERFPELARGPFAPNYVMSAGWNREQQSRFVGTAEEALKAGDTKMVDMLARHALELEGNIWRREGPQDIEWYVEHYRTMDNAEFATRAVQVLTDLPRFEYMGRIQRRQKNELYQVFFGEPARYVSALDRVRDLLESPNEEVHLLALQILFAGDRRKACEVAAQCSDHLQAYLLNDSPRPVRIAAFRAVALAAESSEVIAAQVVDAARKALRLRQRAYPKDRLVELIGQVIHRWPSLQTDAERPVVYDHAEAS